ncbi:MAG: hypothetical protein ACK47B_01080 [Armatimonadota bacterium]
MSTLLQKLLVALGRRGVQTPIDGTLGAAYRALQQYHERYPNVFTHAAEILLAEVEGGATTVDQIPQRMGQLVQMLDRLHREEDVAAWAEQDVVVVV